MITIKTVGPKLYRSSELASGMDLKASEETYIDGFSTGLVKTGLKIAVPKGYEAQVRSRSGLALKKQVWVANSPGTIDADYRGEVGVILYNGNQRSFHVAYGDRIAQLVICPVVHDLQIMDVETLDDTERGEGGFGSTGVSSDDDKVKCEDCNKEIKLVESYIIGNQRLCQDCYDRVVDGANA